MEAMAREAWTDERLDDLKEQMVSGFARVDLDIREMRRTMLQGFFALATIMITGFAALVAAMLF
jgi:hypothetical protein